MRINMEDMRYYLDPIQNPRVHRMSRTGEPVTEYTIIPLRYRRADLNTRNAELLGKPMTVTAQRHEQGEVWWIDPHGDHVQGAPVLDRVDNRLLAVGLIDDETFAVGTSGNMVGGGRVLSNVRRSDGGHSFPGGTNRIVVKQVMGAAAWALDLMPEDGDTQEVVDQKVMMAKQKYDQRYKKGQVYIEGMMRDWLNLLAEVREDGHDMPAPHFAIGASGIALMGGTSAIEATLSAVQRQTVDRLRALPLRATPGGLLQYYGTQFTTVTPVTVNTYEELRNYADLTTHINQAVGYVDGIIEQSRFPILTGF